MCWQIDIRKAKLIRDVAGAMKWGTVDNTFSSHVSVFLPLTGPNLAVNKTGFRLSIDLDELTKRSNSSSADGTW